MPFDLAISHDPDIESRLAEGYWAQNVDIYCPRLLRISLERAEEVGTRRPRTGQVVRPTATTLSLQEMGQIINFYCHRVTGAAHWLPLLLLFGRVIAASMRNILPPWYQAAPWWFA